MNNSCITLISSAFFYLAISAFSEDPGIMEKSAEDLSQSATRVVKKNCVIPDLKQALAEALKRRSILLVACGSGGKVEDSGASEVSIAESFLRGSVEAEDILNELKGVISTLDVSAEKSTEYEIGRILKDDIKIEKKSGKISAWLQVPKKEGTQLIVCIPAAGKIIERLDGLADATKVLNAVKKAKGELGKIPRKEEIVYEKARLSAEELVKGKTYKSIRCKFYPPPDYDPSKRYPCVMTFMGLGMKHVDDNAWSALAKEGIVVVVTWPANNECKPDTSYHDVFQEMSLDVAIDLKKIFALGFSRWGSSIMKQVLAEPESWTGVISVCHCYFENGRRPNDFPKITAENHDLRILVIAGEKDPNTMFIKPMVKSYKDEKFLISLEVIPDMAHLMRKDEVPLIAKWLNEQIDEKRNNELLKKRITLVTKLKKTF